MDEVVGCGLDKSGEVDGEHVVWLVTLVIDASWVVDKTVRIDLRMNALLELKLLHPRKTMNCL